MEFWAENQGQSHLYSKFGTIPGRNCTHNYHDRHQAAHYPLYYGEQQQQQDQCRDSTYWTVPGSRAVGSLHQYTNWTDADLTTPTSSHFPFILDRHTHQDPSEYQPHDTRNWTAAQRGARDYERTHQREGWQRRWEPCNPARYNSNMSVKRNDSSYRELEAWAARYSHSLPRRRRIEAELRGASQGMMAGRKSAMEVATTQHTRQTSDIGESGMWDGGSRKQAPALYQSHSPVSDSSHVLDMKETSGYQRRLFSQPPCYIAPPPYNSPHKTSPVTHQYDLSWMQDTKRQTWSQPTFRKEDVPAHKEKADITKDHIKPEGLMHQREEAECLTPSAILQTERQRTLCLQHSSNQSAKTTEDTSKVIEGRKFRLNKKMGGMTIFCLVSRIAGTAETPTLPLCPSQTTFESKETREIQKDAAEINKCHKLADEVDSPVPNLTEINQTDTVKETPTSPENQNLEDPGVQKVETGDVSSEKPKANNDFTSVRQAQPVSAKYPLWREPSSTNRTESLSVCSVKEKLLEDKSNKTPEKREFTKVSSQPIDIEVRRLDIKENAESEGLMVIDTTCVVVKMELIQSPKKEQVTYLHSANSFKSNIQQNTDAATTEHALGTLSPLKTELEATLTEKQESEIISSSEFSPPACESLEERAERILGIPLNDCIVEHHSEDATSNIDPSEEHERKTEPNSIGNYENAETKKAPEETTEAKEAKSCLHLIQTEDATCKADDTRDQVGNEDVEDSPGSQEQILDESVSETDPHQELNLNVKTQAETSEDRQIELINEKDECDEAQAENASLDDESPEVLISSSPFITESQTSNPEESSDAEFDSVANIIPEYSSSFPHTPLHQPNPSNIPDSSNSSIHAEHLTHPPLPTETLDTSKIFSETEDQSDCVDNEISTDKNVTNMIENVVSQQQCDMENVPVTDQLTNEADEEPECGLEPKLETSDQKCRDAFTLQHLDHVQTESGICPKEVTTTEERTPEEEGLDPSELSEMEKDEVKEGCEEEVKTFDCQFDDDQKEDAIEDPSLKNLTEFPESLWKQSVDIDKVNDPQTQVETGNLKDSEAQTESSICSPVSVLDCEETLNQSSLPDLHSASQSQTNSESFPLLDTSSVCSLLRVPGIADSLEDSALVSSSSFQNTPSAPSPRTTSPPKDEVAPEFASMDAQNEELQYPQSLWDVVNRIRKHTAPDSENEEEEMTEMWDLENACEDLGDPSEAVGGALDISFDNAEIAKASSLHADEDTLSCSSTSSHGSEDTVIIAEEDEIEETTPDVMNFQDDNEAFDTVEGELCYSGDTASETKNEQEEEVMDLTKPRSESAC